MTFWDQFGFAAAVGTVTGSAWWLAAKAFDLLVALLPHRRPS